MDILLVWYMSFITLIHLATHNFLCILTYLQQHNIISDNGRIAGMVYVDRSLSTIQFSDKPRILANVLLNN